MSDRLRMLLVVAVTLMITACTNPPVDHSTPTQQVSGPVSTTPEIVSTSDFVALPFANDIVFAPSADPTCNLPCWQGIRIGQSNSADVQALLDTVFQFHGMIDFYDVDQTDLPPIVALQIPNTFVTGHIWHPGENDIFELYFATDEQTGVVEGISFNYGLFGGAYSARTIQEIVQELGPPSYISIGVLVPAPYLTDEDTLVRIFLLYDQGLAFFSVYGETPYVAEVEGETTRLVTLCLDESISSGSDAIVRPLDRNNSSSFNPVQQAWVGYDLQRSDLIPSDEALGLNINEWTDIALDNSNPCITVDIDALATTP